MMNQNLEGFLASYADAVPHSTTAYVVASVIVLFALPFWIAPSVDSREPPVVKPTIPIIGHIIGLLRHKSYFLKRLNDKHKLPIATLPMLNGKVYAVWDPTLIQAVFRHSKLSFLPFAVDFTQKELNLSKKADEIMKTTDFVPYFFKEMHPAFSGKHLHKMNRNALVFVSTKLNDELTDRQWREIPNLYLWLRDLMTMATSEALYGPGNIMRNDPTLLDDLWTFEDGLPFLLLGVLPKITAAKAWKARERLQAALSKYYTARLDDHEDAADLVKVRAAINRKYGFTDEEVGQIELALLHVATTNTIPTLFWFVAFVLSDSKLLAQLQEEIDDMLQKDGENVTIDITQLDGKCPLLVRCYKESMRLSSHVFNTRRVMEDTLLSDGQGNSYLLKKGVDIQMSGTSSHSLEDVWGPEVRSFNQDRFLPSDNDKSKRAAFHPFGGGRHLCPGRNFAFAENLGFVAALIMGFDVSPLGGDNESWKLPTMGISTLAAAAAKPVNEGEGFGVRIRRREGWEKTRWLYEC